MKKQSVLLVVLVLTIFANHTLWFLNDLASLSPQYLPINSFVYFFVFALMAVGVIKTKKWGYYLSIAYVVHLLLHNIYAITITGLLDFITVDRFLTLFLGILLLGVLLREKPTFFKISLRRQLNS